MVSFNIQHTNFTPAGEKSAWMNVSTRDICISTCMIKFVMMKLVLVSTVGYLDNNNVRNSPSRNAQVRCASLHSLSPFSLYLPTSAKVSGSM